MMKYILYDGRCSFKGTEGAAVLCTADSKTEARKDSGDFADDSVWYEYDVDGTTLINEREWKSCKELNKWKRGKNEV